MRSLLAVCVVLVCFVDKSYGTFADFMNNLPSEVATAFNNAWSSISDAIKKPVRIKRLGSGGKLKTTTTTLYSAEHERHHHYRHTAGNSNPEESPTTGSGNKLALPIIATPKFKSLDEWRNMQKALYVDRKKVDNRGPILIIVEAPNTKTKSIKQKQINNESFATLMYF